MSTVPPPKLFSVDVETEKIHGKFAFAIAAVVRQDGLTIAEYQGRSPTPATAVKWVRENVIPNIEMMPISHGTPLVLEEDFWRFWQTHAHGATCISYFANLGGEAALFYRIINRKYKERMYWAPSPLHELSTLMISKGWTDVHGLDRYMEQHALCPTCLPQTFHHPLYDAHAAALVWEHLMLK